jgi:acetyl esterase
MDLTLDAGTGAFLEEYAASTSATTSLRDLDIEEAREACRAECATTTGVGDQSVTSQDQVISAPGREIAIRIYSPADTGPASALVVFLHGGGFCLGGLDTHDAICRDMVAVGDFVCVSVDYRLSPEHPYPAGLEDCVEALQWVQRHAQELAPGSRELVICGDSAGGNLAASVCLWMRDHQLVLPSRQVLVYPVVDLTMSCDSATSSGSEYGLSSDDLTWYYERYLGDSADAREAWVSPLLCSDLSGLPPAVVVTVGFDPLRDEGRRYAELLAAGGTPTSNPHFAGLIHGSLQLAALVPASRRMLEDVARFIAVGTETS